MTVNHVRYCRCVFRWFWQHCERFDSQLKEMLLFYYYYYKYSILKLYSFLRRIYSLPDTLIITYNHSYKHLFNLKDNDEYFIDQHPFLIYFSIFLLSMAAYACLNVHVILRQFLCLCSSILFTFCVTLSIESSDKLPMCMRAHGLCGTWMW